VNPKPRTKKAIDMTQTPASHASTTTQPPIYLEEGRPGIVRNPQKKRLADCSKTKSHLADAKAGFHRPVLFN